MTNANSNTSAAASADVRRAIGAGTALLTIVLTYDVSRLGEPRHWWVAVGAIGVGIAVGDGLVLVHDRVSQPGLAPLPIVVALLAVGGCVPETDQLAIVAIVPLGIVVAELVTRRQLGVAWYAVAAGIVGWGGLYGATGRASALAGALFAWWALVLVAIVGSRRRDLARRDISQRDVLVLLVCGGVGSLVMARTGGIASEPWVIASWTAACAAGSIAANIVALRFTARRSRRDG